MEKKKGMSRRDFLKKAAVGAGVAAAAATAGKTGFVGKAAAQEPPMEGIKLAPEFVAALNAAPTPKDFPMTGSDVFARACKEEGLAGLFQCPGNYNITHAITWAGIPTWSGRHEGSMAHAADGYARLTGEVTACSGTEGPGFTNMICAIAEANAARTPLLVLASNMNIAGEDAEQGLQMSSPYQQPTTDGMKKYGKRLINPKRIWEYAQFAFRQLKSGVPKPVHLDFPSDISAAKINSPAEQTCWYGKGLYRTDHVAYPEPGAIQEAIDLLKQAKRPMIVSSTGAFYHKAWEPLRKFAERMQIPVTESGCTRGQFSDDHPLSATCAPGSYPSADVVMLVGQYCMPMIGEFSFGPDTKYIRIDPDPNDIGRNLPITVGIVSDEKAAMEALLAASPSMTHDSWVAEITAAEKKFEDENASYYNMTKNYDGVHPAVMGQALADFLKSADRRMTTIVSGGYGVARYTRRFFRAFRPGQMMNCAYHYAAIGPDIGFAVGAGAAMQNGTTLQAAYKGAPFICVTGDAGFGFTAMELETLAKYRMPCVILIYNNNSWGTNSSNYYGTRVAQVHLFQENLRYEKLAEGLGCYGEYITKASDLAPALERGWKMAIAKSLPVVLNCQGKKEWWQEKDKYPPGNLGKIEPGCMAYYH